MTDATKYIIAELHKLVQAVGPTGDRANAIRAALTMMEQVRKLEGQVKKSGTAQLQSNAEYITQLENDNWRLLAEVRKNERVIQAATEWLMLRETDSPLDPAYDIAIDLQSTTAECILRGLGPKSGPGKGMTKNLGMIPDMGTKNVDSLRTYDEENNPSGTSQGPDQENR